MANKYLFERTIYSDYLDKSKVIKAHTSYELNQKIRDQLDKWQVEEEREIKKLTIEQNMKKAIYRTEMAKKNIAIFQCLLKNALEKQYILDFEKFKRKDSFKEFHYVKEEYSLEDIYEEYEVPHKSWLEYIWKPLGEKRIKLEEEAKVIWKDRSDNSNKKYNEAMGKYNIEKVAYEKEQKEVNDAISYWKRDFEEGKKDAVERYVYEVIDKSEYPKEITKMFEIEYNEEEKILIIVYKIPNPDELPKITGYKYVKARNEVDTILMKQSDFDKFYDNVVYQITLRTIYEIYKSIYNNCIKDIVFNGWVDYIDVATGKDVSSCIITVKVSKEEFDNIDFNRIEYKACIKRLKGLFSGKLTSLIPVKPILNLSRDDARFIKGKDILSSMDESTNLAAMHWEDFEHLVGQLFERKFSENGAEVKITQSSRDGGVDAVIFDPNPLNGGKFIIQAKRYNNVVPVSAIRDLYGTMEHEHAVRGILVTTSYFSSDAYDFIKEKALTLINGSELLSMFNDLGYSNLRIKLKENI